MKKLVIFDLDGTLLNTIADLTVCTNHALTECGFPTHTEQEYKLMVGNGIMKLFERALPEGEKSPENTMRLREKFVPYYDLHGSELSCPYPGITELLKELGNRGFKIAVASNKYDAATQRLAAHYFPGTPFSIVRGSREGIAPKPDPAIVDDILAATGMARKDVLFVGDTGVDMQTALNAGVDAAGVTLGFRSRCELEQFSPRHIINTAAELLDCLE